MRFWLNTPKKDTECWLLLIDLSQPNWSMQKYKESKGIDRQKKIYLIYQLYFQIVKKFSSNKCSYSETLKMLIVTEESKWRGTWPS